jgi:VanZ family protein
VLGRPARLLPAAVLAGGTIEALQWALPLGRVVSPVDALLNASGAVVAGLLVAALQGVRRAGSGRSRRVWAGA